MVGSDEENVVALLFSIPYTKLTQENVRCNSMNVKDDALQLAAEILRRYPSKLGSARFNISLVSDSKNSLSLFTYSNYQTPYYFQKRNILKIINLDSKFTQKDIQNDENLKEINFLTNFNSIKDISETASKGFMDVMFNLFKLEEWFQEMIDSESSGDKQEVLEEIWSDQFDFNGTTNTLLLPPFGECMFSEKNVPSSNKINQRALLVQTVAKSGQEGATANTIRREFRSRGLKEPKNRTLDAMMVPINTRFADEFKGVKVILKNIGSQGVKKIKLSVQLLKKR